MLHPFKLDAAKICRHGLENFQRKGSNLLEQYLDGLLHFSSCGCQFSQMMTNFLSPENIKGLSAFSMLLAMIGNGLMIPRALFIRDFMW
ncbi:Maltose excess protein 1-like, chloroplastic [Vitis vinifera]|uniref:Maltose excess protein 1-like, chloroplastic n=1 Tax=Vitis vinifera TaxID=29760 RepID=A0A438G4P4_VITVI|nr:Maltose excess protein 1-like, chloroplastic [Vitis vinifera]